MNRKATMHFSEKRKGIFGPYIWKDTIPTSYQIELPEGVEQYTVNILKGFVFRSWMDYLTFGKYGTGGWASEDGTIQCIESAYDFESEKFTVSLLKHEAQHAKRPEGISRHYSGGTGIQGKISGTVLFK